MFSLYYGKNVMISFDNKILKGILKRVTQKNIDGDRTIGISGHQGYQILVSSLPGFSLYLDNTVRMIRMMLYIISRKVHVNTDVFIVIYSFMGNDYQQIQL